MMNDSFQAKKGGVLHKQRKELQGQTKKGDSAAQE
jgi:hypothetical protein